MIAQPPRRDGYEFVISTLLNLDRQSRLVKVRKSLSQFQVRP